VLAFDFTAPRSRNSAVDSSEARLTSGRYSFSEAQTTPSPSAPLPADRPGNRQSQAEYKELLERIIDFMDSLAKETR